MSQSLAIAGGNEGILDLHRSSCEELQIARVYTRHQTQVCLRNGYASEDDNSDQDEEEGRLYNSRYYHDNGNPKYFKTFTILPRLGDLPEVERLIEEKHFDVDGVCRMDMHFGLGQPYLSRKHYYANQRLKSEKLFFIENERTMFARKAGHWRDYYENGSIMAEMQYDANGMRCGFCKRYGPDGTVEWVKDYTKDYQERLVEFNSKKGSLDLSMEEALELLGFSQRQMPNNRGEIDRMYRRRCAPLHPDKSPDPDAHERFLQISRAREVLLKLLEKK